MDITTIIGLVAGIGFILLGAVMGDVGPTTFFNPGALLITIGGTLAAIFVSYPSKELGGVWKAVGQAFGNPEHDSEESIVTILELAETARKEGLAALKDVSKTLDSPFLQKGLALIAEGADPEVLREIMELELRSTESRHQKYAGLFDSIAALAPAYGMIGAIVGLIVMFGGLSAPSALASGMVTALVTLLYGAVIANLVAAPLASKLRIRSAEEIQHKELLLEGVLSVQAGELPNIIQERLYSFLARSEKKETGNAGNGRAGEK